MKEIIKMYNGIEVLRLDKNAILPTRNNPTDAGLDIYSLEDIFIEMGTTAIIKTGIAIKVPTGFVLKIEDRSGLGAKGLRTGAGVIDAGYNGPINVVLHNFSSDFIRTGEYGHFKLGYQVHKGDRIAQALLYKVETPIVVEVNDLWESERGSKGFSSSGR